MGIGFLWAHTNAGNAAPNTVANLETYTKWFTVGLGGASGLLGVCDWFVGIKNDESDVIDDTTARMIPTAIFSILMLLGVGLIQLGRAPKWGCPLTGPILQTVGASSMIIAVF